MLFNVVKSLSMFPPEIPRPGARYACFPILLSSFKVGIISAQLAPTTLLTSVKVLVKETSAAKKI